MSEKFAAWLDAEMMAFGYTGQRLAADIGVRDSTVSRWRTGTWVPAVPALRELARIFRVRLADLMVLAGHLSPDELPEAAPPSVNDRAGEIAALRKALTSIANIAGRATEDGLLVTVHGWGLDDSATDALFNRVAEAAHALDEQVTCSGRKPR